MKNYALASEKELFEQFQNNFRVLATVLKELLGDEPVPDPRQLLDSINQMTVDEFINSFLRNRSEVAQTMDLQKEVLEVTFDNLAINEELLNRY
jgi:hypothetical protein